MVGLVELVGAPGFRFQIEAKQFGCRSAGVFKFDHCTLLYPACFPASSNNFAGLVFPFLNLKLAGVSATSSAGSFAPVETASFLRGVTASRVARMLVLELDFLEVLVRRVFFRLELAAEAPGVDRLCL